MAEASYQQLSDGQPKKKKQTNSSMFRYFYNDEATEQVGSTAKARDLSQASGGVLAKKKFGPASLFYGADDFTEDMIKKEITLKEERYQESIAKREADDVEIMALKGAAEGGAALPGAKQDKVLQVKKDNRQRSEKTGRLYPEPNKTEMLKHESIKFLFTKMTPSMMMHLWDHYTMLFCVQCSCVLIYALVLGFNLASYWPTTITFGVIFAMCAIQNVYCLHDVIHGATFPPHWWQRYITHCWADFFSLAWEDVVLEHNRHHASTPDLLMHGEFGWDPAEWLYVLQEKTWLTVPLVPLWHFIGASDTGGLFACLWYSQFPEMGPQGQFHPQFWKKWFPQRLKHTLVVFSLWALVWLLGSWTYGSLALGWKLVLPVAISARIGFSLAWVCFTNVNHSEWWAQFLANAPERTHPVVAFIMSIILGGPERFNEMLFHDVHHAFPNAVGALSQRGRFYGWMKVHQAAMETLRYGLFTEDKTSTPPAMKKHQDKRSIVFAEAGN